MKRCPTLENNMDKIFLGTKFSSIVIMLEANFLLYQNNSSPKLLSFRYALKHVYFNLYSPVLVIFMILHIVMNGSKCSFANEESK